MDLAFTDEQDMHRSAVRGLCADATDSVRALENDPKGYDEAFWQGLAAMGLTGLMTPEVLGGSGMGMLDAVVVYEELGRSLVPSPHLASSSRRLSKAFQSAMDLSGPKIRTSS